MDKSVTELFIELAEIDSESRNERKIADRVREELENIGLEVHEDNCWQKTGGNAGNIYAYLPGKIDRKPLLFCAHIDTVKPGNGVKAIIESDRITSDGETILGADDKSGVAQIICGIKKVIESGFAYPPVEVLLTVCEEVGLLGMRYFDKSLLKSSLGFAFDSGKVGRFIVSAPSQNTINVKVYGKEAHAGVNPEKGINAIRVASEAIAAIPLGKIDFETTANIGIINGGNATNIVPKFVEIKGETRSHNQQKLVQVTTDIVKTFEKTAEKHELNGEKARVEIEVHQEYKSFHLDEHSPVVKLCAEASEKIGIPPSFSKGGGGSDANVANAEGFSMIMAGTGMQEAHTVNEYITLDELEKGVLLVEALIKTYSK